MDKKSHNAEQQADDRLDNGELPLSSDAQLMRETSEVFARQSLSAPDPKAAWEAFRQQKIGRRKRRRTHLFLWGGGVAAAVAGLALFFVLRSSAPDGVQPASLPTSNQVAQAQGVTITTASGEQQVVGTSRSDSLLTAAGIQVGDKSINYREAETAEMQSLSVPRGHDFKITLSDGSEVWLNAESQLSYPSKFGGAERKVELTGEGYFKIAKDRSRPFIVLANSLATRVTGTEFNMKVYRDAPPHVTLVEGKIHVKHVGQEKEVELSPGEDAFVDSQGRLAVQNVDVYSYIQWKSGYFYFDNVPLKEVICELERWYNVDIEVADPAILSLHVHYTANKREDITKAVEKLNELNQIVVTIAPDGKIRIE